MNNSDTEKKKVRITLLLIAFSLYVLEGILFNPLIIWTILPLYIGYLTIKKAWKMQSQKKLHQGYGFIIVSMGFSYFYHFAWFFDWDGAKTGSSTSALIFIWFPMYAVILGYIGYFFGTISGSYLEDTTEPYIPADMLEVCKKVNETRQENDDKNV